MASPTRSWAASAWYQPRDAGLIGRCLRRRQPVIENDVQSLPDYQPTPETEMVTSALVVPLWVGDSLWGVLNIEETGSEPFDEDDARLVQTVADQVGAALRSATLYQQLDSAYIGTVQALASALEAKDNYTADHSRAVVDRAHAVGVRLGMSEPELRTLRFAAIFHDIGKVAVQDDVLAKRGPLSSSERTAIESHTVVGEQILSSVDFLSEVLPLIRHEHERWDGGGYPDGLAGESIPLGSRIVLACDAYDAMTSDRPYRAAMTDSQARAELLAGAGRQFDERVIAALLQVLDEGRRGSARHEPGQVVLPAARGQRPERAPWPLRGSGSAPARRRPPRPPRAPRTRTRCRPAPARRGRRGETRAARPRASGAPRPRACAAPGRPGRWPIPR